MAAKTEMEPLTRIELEPLTKIVREVQIALQNSSGTVLTLNNYSLTEGQWDPEAPRSCFLEVGAEQGLPWQGW